MVIIIGCSHGIQAAEPDWSICLTCDQVQKAVGQRRKFGQMLEGLIQQFQPSLIAEEWGLPVCTIAKGIARRKRTRWTNMNTTLEERKALGIPSEDYTGGDYCKQQVAHWHSLRERVMFRKTKRLRNSARPAVVICGFDHIEGLRRLFGNAGEEVRVKDYRCSPWYDANALS
jgi:hypothetical protein